MFENYNIVSGNILHKFDKYRSYSMYTSSICKESIKNSKNYKNIKINC